MMPLEYTIYRTENFCELIGKLADTVRNGTLGQVEQISQLATFAEALLDYHQQCVEILRSLTETLLEKKQEAAERPKSEFVPKTLHDLHVEGLADGLNGTHPHHPVASTGQYGRARHDDPFDPWHAPPVKASPLPSPMRSPARSAVPKMPCCTALYDFEPENPGELGFKEGETITLTNKIDENWYEGTVNGRTGYFPVTYVQVIVPLP